MHIRTTRGIKHWVLSGYSSVLPRIKFCVTGQDSSPQSPALSVVCNYAVLFFTKKTAINPSGPEKFQSPGYKYSDSHQINVAIKKSAVCKHIERELQLQYFNKFVKQNP
jgi:hypothetical protein